ncbi:tyrosine-type recombinase/integrase [Bacillus subtilis]|nr:tyrosine-type recombinase/integrase [Bacillus subtilis]
MYYIVFKTLLETGMRKGEAAALQRKDIDLKNNFININKSLDFQVKEGEEIFGETKTYESERRIKISNSLAKELAAHMNYLNDNRIVFNEIYEHELDLVFCRQDGKPLPKSTLFKCTQSHSEESWFRKNANSWFKAYSCCPSSRIRCKYEVCSRKTRT